MAVGTLAIFLLVLFIIVVVVSYQKRMLQSRNSMRDQAIEIAEKERENVARAMHDDVGFILSMLKIRLEMMTRNREDAESFNELVADGNSMIEQSLESVRAIYNDVLPPTLMKFGFVRGLRELCLQISASEVIQARFESNVEVVELDERPRIKIFRLLKEVLNNLIKHGQPTTIDLKLMQSGNVLEVTFVHNGTGITTKEIRKLSENSKGLGLKSIINTVDLMKGDIQYRVKADHNEIFIYLPIK